MRTRRSAFRVDIHWYQWQRVGTTQCSTKGFKEFHQGQVSARIGFWASNRLCALRWLGWGNSTGLGFKCDWSKTGNRFVLYLPSSEKPEVQRCVTCSIYGREYEWFWHRSRKHTIPVEHSLQQTTGMAAKVISWKLVFSTMEQNWEDYK